MLTLEIWHAKDGWRWRLKARNGKIVAESGEAYTRRYGAWLGWLRVEEAIHFGEWREKR